MTVIPAQVAGVRTICVTSPHPSAEILAVAEFLGIEKIFRIGGAQAIAALAFGTATVPEVDRIVGPATFMSLPRRSCWRAKSASTLSPDPPRS